MKQKQKKNETKQNKNPKQQLNLAAGRNIAYIYWLKFYLLFKQIYYQKHRYIRFLFVLILTLSRKDRNTV